MPDITCLFEREAADVAWRHAAEEPESRRKRDLVVRSAAVLGNYDYLFDWSFQQDGSIRVSVGATGIAQVKSTVAASADDAYVAHCGDEQNGRRFLNSAETRSARPAARRRTDAEVLALRDGLYMLAGPGATVTVQVADEGVLLVDTGADRSVGAPPPAPGGRSVNLVRLKPDTT